jgi:hypothetical protein
MKRIGILTWLLIACAIHAPWTSFAGEGITLLLVPREDKLVHLGRDVGARHPTLLISYRLLPNGSVSLHGWSGTEWVNVTPESFAEGSFFLKQPDSAVLVWQEGAQIPEVLIPSHDWCPMAYGIATTEMRILLHLLGRHYDFKYDDWKWFSDSYKMPFESINPDNVNVSWYHRRLRENLNQPAVSAASDLDYYSLLSAPAAVPEGELDVPADEPVNAASEEAADVDNPLTNAVPQATILGAGEASATADDNADAPGDESEAPDDND